MRVRVDIDGGLNSRIFEEETGKPIGYMIRTFIGLDDHDRVKAYAVFDIEPSCFQEATT